MKKSFLVLVALLLSVAASADVTPVVTEPLTLVSADTSASTNLRAVSADESTLRLEKEAQAASDALGAIIEAKLAEAIKKEVAVNVKF